MSTCLYRHFAADGQLLYVGISISALQRLVSHRNQSGWADLITKITVERFPNKRRALDAERSAIKAEQPLWNVMHNQNEVFPNLWNVALEQLLSTCDEVFDPATGMTILKSRGEAA